MIKALKREHRKLMLEGNKEKVCFLIYPPLVIKINSNFLKYAALNYKNNVFIDIK